MKSVRGMFHAPTNAGIVHFLLGIGCPGNLDKAHRVTPSSIIARLAGGRFGFFWCQHVCRTEGNHATSTL